MKGKHKAITVQFLKTSEAKHTFQWYGNSLDYFYRVHLNPYSGKILKIENTQWEFFHVVQMIHTTLFLGHVGTIIMSFSVLAFVILLFTGIVLWWTVNKKALKLGTSFGWTSKTRWRRKNYDLHKILGFYSSWISIVIAVTGLVWAFKCVDSGVQWLANGGQTIVSKPVVYKPSSTMKTVHNGLDKIFDSIPKQYPNATYAFISLPKDSIAPYYTYVREHENINEYIASYDQHSGERVELSSFDKLSIGEKIRSLNYSIHVGSILGVPGKILAFFASLISASLPVTGFLIWWGRRKRKKAPTRKRVTSKTS
ncbi:MAG: PepSY-associated TM helix domain-containing protein [Croceivirga sp.]